MNAVNRSQLSVYTINIAQNKISVASLIETDTMILWNGAKGRSLLSTYLSYYFVVLSWISI